MAVSEKFSLHPNVWNAMRFVGVLILKVFTCSCSKMLKGRKAERKLTNILLEGLVKSIELIAYII